MQTYADIDYAQSRLPDTIVMMKGEPVEVLHIKAKGVIEYISLVNDGEVRVGKLVDLDITPVPLGYVNEGAVAIYLTRTPMRQDWRQGLRLKNIRNSKGGQVRDYKRHTLANCIMDKYPTIHEAYNTLCEKSGIKSIAFSRNFALLTNDSIEYKGTWIVGKVEVDHDGILVPQITPKYEWVRESFNEESDL